jgi:hypothetical protein
MAQQAATGEPSQSGNVLARFRTSAPTILVVEDESIVALSLCNTLT